MNKVCKKKIFQRQVETAIRTGWGNCSNFLKRLEQINTVNVTDLSFRTEIKEWPSRPEIPLPAHISEFVAKLEELMGRMKPTFYGPSKPHLWLVGGTPPENWENCRETSERKARTHSCDVLIDLSRENDSHMDTYWRKHL